MRPRLPTRIRNWAGVLIVVISCAIGWVLIAGQKTEPPKEDVALSVVLFPRGTSGAVKYEKITCLAIDRSKRCESLRKADWGYLSGAPKDQVCTALYGGPGVSQIDGHVARRRIHVRLAQRNGCEIARWNRASELLDFPRVPNASYPS